MTDKKPVHNEEFSWTVHDFSRPKKVVEEVKIEWPKEPERPRRTMDLDEPISFDIDAFKKKSENEKLPQEESMFVHKKEEVPVEKAAEPSPEQKIQELSELTEKLRKQQNAERQAAAQNAMNSTRQAAAEEAREESLRKADPFFHFSDTNIAFQDLLDQEYEKIQKRKEGAPYVESQWRYHGEEEEAELPKPEEVMPEPEPELPDEPELPEPEPELSEPELPELPESPEEALERMILEGTRTIDPDNDATIQVDLSAIKKAAAQRYGYAEEEAETEEPVPVIRAVEEIAVTREEEIPAEEKKSNTMTEMEKAREAYFNMLDQEINGVKVKVEVDFKPNQTGERHTTVLESADVKGAADAWIPEEPKVTEEPKEPERPFVTERPAAAETEEFIWPLDPSQYEEEEEGGGFLNVLGKILLVVIALVILLEIGALGILYFAPDSSIAGKVYGIQEKVIGLIDSVTNGDENEVEGNVPPVVEEIESPADGEQVDPVGQVAPENPVEPAQSDAVLPMKDKTALIQTQMEHNKNIKSITANDALKYKSGANYGIVDLNQSEPIENNLWYTDEAGNPVYYDQEIVGALIAFNSQWVDYVNNGDKSVLDITKEGSDAYNQAVKFSKVGKIKEEFVSVQIGEIRQGEREFYLWVAEEIKITENGKTSTSDYRWVYCMQPVGKEMKITDYISFKNI